MSEFFLVWLAGIETGVAMFVFIWVVVCGGVVIGQATNHIAVATGAIIMLTGVFVLSLIVLAPNKQALQEMIQIVRHPDQKTRPNLPLPPTPQKP